MADCAKDFINGQNNVNLENAKMQYDAFTGAFVLGGIALAGVIANNLFEKCDEISVGANKDGVPFRAKKHKQRPKGD